MWDVHSLEFMYIWLYEHASAINIITCHRAFQQRNIHLYLDVNERAKKMCYYNGANLLDLVAHVRNVAIAIRPV